GGKHVALGSSILRHRFDRGSFWLRWHRGGCRGHRQDLVRVVHHLGHRGPRHGSPRSHLIAFAGDLEPLRGGANAPLAQGSELAGFGGSDGLTSPPSKEEFERL